MKIKDIDNEILNSLVTFGNVYKGKPLSVLLVDKSYCSFLVGQNWFQNSHPNLLKLIREILKSDENIKSDQNECYTLESILDFGRYKNQKVKVMLLDVPYCDWFLAQEWIKREYSDLHSLISSSLDKIKEKQILNSMRPKYIQELCDVCVGQKGKVLAVTNVYETCWRCKGRGYINKIC